MDLYRPLLDVAYFFGVILKNLFTTILTSQLLSNVLACTPIVSAQLGDTVHDMHSAGCFMVINLCSSLQVDGRGIVDD